MKQEFKKPLIPLLIFIFFNGLKVAISTQVITSFPLQYFLLKLLSSVAACGFFIVLLCILKKPVYIIIFYLIQAIFISINIAYYFFFNRYLHLLSVISLVKETSSLLNHFSIPMEWEMLWTLLDLPFFIYFLAKYSSINKYLISLSKIFNNKNIKRANAFILNFFAIFFICFLIFSFIDSPFKLASSNNFADEVKSVYFYGLLENSVAVFIKNPPGLNWAKLLDFGPTCTFGNPGDSIKNKEIFIFQIEALESTAIFAKHDGEFVTPFLKELADKSLFFPFCLSYHKGGNTSDAEFAIINSVEPLDEYPAMKLGEEAFKNSFIKFFNNAGFESYIFHGNQAFYFDRDKAFKKAGFQEYYDIKKMGLKQYTWGAEDEEVFAFAVNKLNEQKEPFLYYLISMSSHEPYNLINIHYQNKRFDNIKDSRTKNYFNSINYLDQALEKSIEAILKKYPDALIVVFGDHSTNIRKNEYYRNAICRASSGLVCEFVPLIIYGQGITPHRENQFAVSFLDIAPTILSLASVNAKINTYGEDLTKYNDLKNSIPFRGEKFSRKELFSLIYEALKEYINK
jgi:phosphoglycerol transferase MdoB-like AlkP superfamily enzyme